MAQTLFVVYPKPTLQLLKKSVLQLAQHKVRSDIQAMVGFWPLLWHEPFAGRLQGLRCETSIPALS